MDFKGMMMASAFVLAPVLALGQAEFKASDVIEHFKPTNEAAAGNACAAGVPCLQKKKTRAVCIGTDSACAAEETAAAPAAKTGFDLLITFELGSDRLSDQAKVNLREFAKAMKSPALADATFNVDGHTDARGSDSYNTVLSQRRAAAVVTFLKSLGVDEARLDAKGHGESRPRTDDPFAPINRRVEATIRTQ